jgi:hypothetical protein
MCGRYNIYIQYQIETFARCAATPPGILLEHQMPFL